MIQSLLLVIIFLPSPPASAQESTQHTEQKEEKPDPQLYRLDQALTSVQEDKKQGRIDERRYGQFLTKFRADLESTMARIEPAPANTALHARILSRLGDSERAASALGPALEQDPDNPTLRLRDAAGNKAAQSIDDLAQVISTGKANPEGISPVRLVLRNGKLFTLDNRRLEAFRRANMKIPYRMATADEIAEEAWKFTSKTGGETIRIIGE